MKPKFLTLIPIAVSFSFFQLSAQKINRNVYTTDGPVYSTAQRNDTLFLGGSFSQMGYGVRKIARYLLNTTKPDFSFTQLTQDAILKAVEPDGNGGYYLCGRIYSYNGVTFNNPLVLSMQVQLTHLLVGNCLPAGYLVILTATTTLMVELFPWTRLPVLLPDILTIRPTTILP